MNLFCLDECFDACLLSFEKKVKKNKQTKNSIISMKNNLTVSGQNVMQRGKLFTIHTILSFI